MNIKIIIHTLLVCSFSFVHSMESIISSDVPVTDENLQKIIGGLNKTSAMVTFIKKQADSNYVKLTPHTLKPFLGIDQKNLNTLFLDNVENDQLRPLFLSMGANINAQTEDKRNCLWFTKKEKLLEHLIQQGAQINVLDCYEQTRLGELLHCLTHSDAPENITAACALLRHEANPTMGVHLKSAHIKKPGPETPLTRAVRMASTELVKLLLLNKINPNTPNARGEYPLHIAMPEPKSYDYFDDFYSVTIIPEIVISLLEHGANPNRPYPFPPTLDISSTGNTPLHAGVLLGNPAVITALLKHDAKKHLLNDAGKTAFDLAQPEHCYQQLGKDVVNSLMPDPTEVLTFSTRDYVDPETAQLSAPTARSGNPEQANGGCSLQ